MRFRPASRAALAAASLLATWANSDRSARADILVGSTLIPTSSVVTTSSYIPTSYVGTSYLSSSYIPTSYVVPTSSYVTTGSILGSSYYPTSYVGRYRGGLFRPRRYVERTSYYGTSTSFLTPTSYYSPTSFVTPTAYFSSAYVPTSFVSSSILPTSYLSSYIPTAYVVPTMATSSIMPTTYLSSPYVTPTSYLMDDGLIATSASTASVCCDSTPAPARSVAPARAIAPSTAGKTITSEPITGETTTRSTERPPSATVSPVPADEAMSLPPTATPAVPLVPRQTPTEVSPPNPVPPVDKEPEIAVPPPGGSRPTPSEASFRTNRKPVEYPPTRNVLRGRVVSFETGRAEEAVDLVLTSRTNAFVDRATRTDADGEFKISLPDGDWVVKVTMPSGSVYTLGRSVTASGGQVVDRNGRNVGEYLITR